MNNRDWTLLKVQILELSKTNIWAGIAWSAAMAADDLEATGYKGMTDEEIRCGVVYQRAVARGFYEDALVPGMNYERH